MTETRVALIAGVTGIAGLNLAKKMLSTDKYGKWKIYGLSRRNSDYLPPEVNHISCDLLDVNMCKERLAPLTDITHVFYTTWINKVREVENIEANGAMLRNLFDHLPAKLQHVVLLTGQKHYMGPFDSLQETLNINPTPYKESFARIPGDNFYYTQEDIVVEKAKEQGFTWSVARSACIVGFAPFHLMNLGTSIAVYAAICKYSGRPFIFPGTKEGYDFLIDVTDADLLAEHMMWEATDPAAKNQAYNVANGDLFRFRQMWKTFAEYFELHVPDQVGPAVDPRDLQTIWDEMMKKLGLLPMELDEVCQCWFLTAVFGLPKDVFYDLTKSREHGFLLFQNSEKAFLKLFDYLREKNIIPARCMT